MLLKNSSGMAGRVPEGVRNVHPRLAIAYSASNRVIFLKQSRANPVSGVFQQYRRFMQRGRRNQQPYRRGSFS